MLTVINDLKDLDFTGLMAVYEEGNRENGHDLYPHLPENLQILQAEQDFYHYLKETFFFAEGAAYCLWQPNDEIVSALRLEPYQNGYLMEALETAPKQRKKGYATALMLAVQDWMEPGSVLYSHVGKWNVPSLAVHLKCGFEKILDHAVYIDGSVTQRSVTLQWKK